VASEFRKKMLDSSSLVSAIRNAIWLLGGAAASIGYVYTKGTSFGVLLSVGALLILAAVVAALLIRRKLRRVRVELAAAADEIRTLKREVEILTDRARELTDTPFGYRVKSIKYTYGFDPDDYSRHYQDCHTEIEATRNDVSLFEARYSWSGQGSSEPSLRTRRQILLKHPQMRFQGFNHYYVHLQRPLMIGERTQIRVHQDLIDRDRRMDPQLTKTVRESIDSLTLCVKFPEAGPGKKDVRALARRSARDDSDVIEILEFDYDDSERRASVRIEKPERGITYAIEWAWDGYRNDGLAVRPRRSRETIEHIDQEGDHVQ
jgi:hypothetical protein